MCGGDGDGDDGEEEGIILWDYRVARSIFHVAKK